MNLCKKCNKPTGNPKYCSRSCAASVNNAKPKRQRTALCAFCGKHTKSAPRSGVRKCRECYLKECANNFGEKTIGDFTSTYSRHKYQNVRNHAHNVARLHNLEKACSECGYDKTVDLCHKIPIASFSPETKLKVVNDIKNLVYLCPNHHWELDHGLLEMC